MTRSQRQGVLPWDSMVRACLWVHRVCTGRNLPRQGNAHEFSEEFAPTTQVFCTWYERAKQQGRALRGRVSTTWLLSVGHEGLDN